MPVRLISQEELPSPLTGYRLIERLGRGGFGEVWKVEAPGGLHKAVKFVFGDLDAAEEEGRPAEQEQKALKRVRMIRHPYILSLERFDVIDGQLIIVMELADRNLWDRFRECRGQGLPGIPRAELLGYMEETAEALDLMNIQHQIQHLDVKPQNLFLVYNHVKVGDFGLAKMFEGARGTVTGGVTPVYAAPETFEGYVSRFSDQYSLAIVFQELLTGTRPFNGSNTKRLLLQHLQDPPDVSPLPAADQSVVARAMAKAPAERWPSSTDMVRALRHSGADPNQPVPTNANIPTPARSPSPISPISETYTPKSDPTRPRGTIPAAYPMPVSPPGTPLPTLVTPRLVTPKAAAGGGPAGPLVTAPRPQVFETGRMTSLGIAPPEKAGDGVLFPALVVGIGRAGLAVIRAMRHMVRERFGSADAVPTLRFLYIDTDPDAIAAAAQGEYALTPREIVPARLNRPAHYLQRDGLPPVEQWMPSGLLYRLPKNAGPTGGVRAFGRLALCDHYRTIAQRVRQEIETFLTDDPLDRTAEKTGLGVRTNRPRAYLAAGLGGGTGSGMLVDLAYILRHELKSVGYRKPETIGILLAPPADKAASRPTALANAYATLSEIAHFTSGVRYQTRFDNSEAPITDPDGPFARTMVVTLPRSGKPRDLDRVVGAVARGVFLDVLTAAGKTADLVRSLTPKVGSAMTVGSFGLYRLSWPRAEVLAVATRRFCQRLLKRWAAKDAPHLKEPIREWLTDQWVKIKLDPGSIAIRFEQVVADALKENPDAVFDAAVHAVRTATPGTPRPDPAAARDVLDRLVAMVGGPDDPDNPGTLQPVLTAAAKKLGTEAETSLSTVTVSFLEQPQYRLAGCEEALNQTRGLLQGLIKELEANRPRLAEQAADVFARLAQLFAARRATAAELADTLRAYPSRRMRLMETDAALSLYRVLLDNLPEFFREVNFCRSRLGELSQGFAASTERPAPPGPGTVILPDGCDNLDAAADRFLAALPEEDILTFDQDVQKKVAKKFRGVVNVCLKPDRSPDFLALLSADARVFLDARLPHADPAAVFLEYRGGPVGQADLRKAFEQAVPDVLAAGLEPAPAQAAILAAPVGPAGDMVREMAAAVCPGVEFYPAPLTDDIVLYRECPRVPLTSLPQLGPIGRDAFAAQSGSEDAPPRARTDAAWPE